MSHIFTDPDLAELDRIWPVGQMLSVPTGGTILIAGAYYGRYFRYLKDRFPTASIIGYEPNPDAYHIALNLPWTSLYPRALGTANRKVRMTVEGDGSNCIRPGSTERYAYAVDAVEAILNLGKIDLFLMNMEGSEWSVLPYLLDEMMHHRIETLAIQFHPTYVSSVRMLVVLEYLSSYYRLLYDNIPTWSYWKRI